MHQLKGSQQLHDHIRPASYSSVFRLNFALVVLTGGNWSKREVGGWEMGRRDLKEYADKALLISHFNLILSWIYLLFLYLGDPRLLLLWLFGSAGSVGNWKRDVLCACHLKLDCTPS